MDLLRLKKIIGAGLLSLIIAVPSASAVLVGEEDGSPDHTATAAWAIKFANGTLTVNADGTVSHDQAGAGGGTTDDDVSVNSSPVDTTANFLDGDIDWTLTDGGLGGPDDITGTLDATYAAGLNVGSATALAANGANCSAGSAPLGVDASGASESCTDYEEDLSNEAGLYAALADVTNFLQTGDALAGDDITDGSVDETELAANSVDSSELVDGGVDESHLAASLVFDDGDLLSFASVSINGTAEGLILPQHATDCSTAGTAEGQVCWEADADTLYIGDGATVTSITGGGISNVVEDTTPDLGGILTGSGFDQTGMGTISMIEQAEANADVAGSGQIWVNTATPNELWFTDDAGTDTQLGVGGGSSEWTDSGTVVYPTETTDDVSIGSATLVNSSKLSIDGDADQVQLTVQGNGTQTDSTVIIENSAGTEVATIDNDGTISSAVGLDAIGATSITLGSADVTSLIVTTDGTGTGEVQLPAQSIGSSEIANDAIGATQLDETDGYTWTGANDFGGATLEVPNTTVAGLGTATLGRFAIVTDGSDADDCTTGSGSTQVSCMANGATWEPTGDSGSGGGATTDGGAVTYVTSATDDFAIGGTTSAAPFFFDESAESLTVGTSGAGNVDLGTNTLTDDILGNLLKDWMNLPVQSAKITGAHITTGASIDAGDGNWRLLFSGDATDEGLWQFRMPNTYGSNPVAKIGYSMSAGCSSTKVDMEVKVMAVTDGDSADIGTGSFATLNEITGGTSCPATAGYLDEISISLTNDDSVVAGDLVLIHVQRDHDDADDTETTADLELVYLQLEWDR